MRRLLLLLLVAACARPARNDPPAAVIEFFQIERGQKVGEINAQDVAVTRALAKTVGPDGKVYAHGAEGAAVRLSNVVALEGPLEQPFAPDVRDLDAVISMYAYHQAVESRADRAKMNAAVFAALKPGGLYGIVDHSAEPKHGDRDVQTLHRIDEELVSEEVQAAGFLLDDSSDALRAPGDQRNDDAERHPGDRFVLKFRKPPGPV